MDENNENLINYVKKLLSGMSAHKPQDAVEFPKDLPWINASEPLTLEMLKGHVILFDFWTYCCINCIHVLDDLKYLEEKYRDKPFVVIGVHSAKFKNEKDADNIRAAVARYEIKHPVLVDNDMMLWRTYGVNAWPTFVLIGTDGKAIGKFSGEGQRDALDNSITSALNKGRKEGTIAEKRIDIEPEIYLESYLKFPGKIEIDPDRNHLYMSDSNHNRILLVELEENNIGTTRDIIGSGESGFKDGSFEEARFNKPQGIVYKDEKLYVADTENHAIRIIDLKNKLVKTIAGTGSQGYSRKYSGDPLKVSLSSPWDLEIDDEYLYIAMAGTHQLWRLNLNKNIIENFVGSGREDIIDGTLLEAALAQPSGLALDDEKKRLYFADSEVSALRYADLKEKKVHTLIGKGLFAFGMRSGAFNNALLQHPLGVDANGDNIYIADTYNHAIRLANLRSNEISNLIYRPKKGICKIGDKDCDVLPLYEPNDVKFYENKIYIADTNNHLIRVFDLKEETLEDLYLIQL